MKNNQELEMTVENYFQKVTKKSWTWQKLTEEEKERFITLNFDLITGTAKKRMVIFNLVYHAFLVGLGYKPIGWRED
jgi:hypothetical protein